jgi:parallel beta-helix repeat protein
MGTQRRPQNYGAGMTVHDNSFHSPAFQRDLSVINVKLPPAPLVGAVGDGITNDTVAIQAIIDHVGTNGGGTIFFPEGDYLISQTIVIGSSRLNFVGVGYVSIIRTSADIILFQSFSNDDLLFDALHLIGSRSTDTEMGDGHAILVSDANRISVKNCIIQDFSGNGIHFTGFYGTGMPATNFDQGVWDSRVHNNYISRCTQGVMNINDCRRVSIARNTVLRVASVGIFADDSHRIDGTETPRACTGISIEGNNIEEFLGTGIAFAGTQESFIRGNSVMRGGQVGGTQPNANGITLQMAQNTILCKRNIVEGNIVAYNTNIGIVTIGASSNIIRNNHVYNNSYLRSSGGSSQVEFQSVTINSVVYGSKNNVFEGNFCEDDSANSTTGNQIKVLNSDCIGNVIKRNILRGGGSVTKVNDLGTSTVIADNIEDTIA